MLSTIERYTRSRTDAPDLLRGALAGAAGGFVGSMRMNRVMTLWERANANLDDLPGDRIGALQEDRSANDDDPLPGRGDRVQAQAKRTVGTAAVEAVKDTPATRTQVDVAATAVHQATGVLAGAAYGVAVELLPGTRKLYGLPLGIGTFLLGRQVGLWMTGLSPRPDRQAPADQLGGFTFHLIYGVFTEIMRRNLRRIIED
jgi:hypothetical protein